MRKWSQEVLVCSDLVIPSQGQGQRKWHKMVQVNGACKHGRYEGNTLHVLQPRWTNDVTTLFFTLHHRPISKHLWQKIVLDSVQPFSFHATKCLVKVTGLLPAVLTFHKVIFEPWCFMTAAMDNLLKSAFKVKTLFWRSISVQSHCFHVVQTVYV